MPALDVAVPGVPGNVVAVDGMRKLHDAHPFLDQAPGDQAAFGELALAVELAGLRAFFRNVEDLGHRKLHPEGHLHRLDASLEILVLFEAFQVEFVDLCQEIGLLALLLTREVGVLQIANDGVRFHVLDVDVGTGVGAGEEGVPPVGELATRLGPRGHRDKAREVFGFRAEPVGQP